MPASSPMRARVLAGADGVDRRPVPDAGRRSARPCWTALCIAATASSTFTNRSSPKTAFARRNSDGTLRIERERQAVALPRRWSPRSSPPRLPAARSSLTTRRGSGRSVDDERGSQQRVGLRHQRGGVGDRRDSLGHREIERAVRQLGARIGAQPVEGGGMSSARPFSAGLDCACPLTSRTPAFFAGRSIALFASAR